MLNQTAETYNKIYTKDSATYGTDPLPSVVILADCLTGGASILEIGAGTGRNSLYLAARGFHVTATDISTRGLEIIDENAARMNTAIKTRLHDIATDELTETYDAIICTFVLQHLTSADARAAVARMQAHTNARGYNLLCTFTQDGDFFRANPNTDSFYLKNKEQLSELYSGWEIEKLFEREGKARSLTGERQTNMFAGIIARKP